MTVVAYAVLAGLNDRGWLTEYPFGFAALAGLIFFAARTFLGQKNVLEVTATGLSDRTTGVSILWSEVSEVRIDDASATQGLERAIRTITIAAGPEEISFGDEDDADDGQRRIANGPLLLATIAARTGNPTLLPPSWRNSIPAQPTEEPAPARAGFPVVGLTGIALVMNFGPKLAQLSRDLFTMAKPGATISAYSLVFSWKFALALLLHLLVQQFGHLFAMWRSDIAIKGRYLLPFVGVALSPGTVKTRLSSAYVGLNGPLWGTILSVLLAILYFSTGTRWPFLGAMAAWGALINLFSLLPVFPLNGGSVLAAIAHSAKRGVAPIVTSAFLFLAASIAYLADLQLAALLICIGLFEFGEHLTAAPYRRSLQLVDDRPMGIDEMRHFVNLLLRPNMKKRDRALHHSMYKFYSRLREAQQAPMTMRQTFGTLAIYFTLAAVLLAVLYGCTGIPGAGNPLDMLRSVWSPADIL